MGALKAVVVVLGLLIVAVAGLIGIELYQRSDKIATLPTKAGMPVVSVPKDAIILDVTAAGEKLVLRYALSSGDERLVVLDLTRGGQPIATIQIERTQ